MNLFSLLFIIGIVFIALYFIYLYSITNYFNSQINKIQGSRIQLNIYGAIFCYIALIFGLWFFIIREKRPIWHAFLLGLVIYAVYEFTNWALFKDWSIKTVLIDTLWGGILFSLTTKFIYTIYKVKSITRAS